MKYFNIVFYSALVGTLPVFVPILIAIISDLISYGKIKTKFDKVDGLLSWLFFTSTFICIFFIFEYVNDTSDALYFVATFVVTVFISSYSFLLYPMFVLLRKKKYECNKEIDTWIKGIYKKHINIRIINDDIINAYATGVLPFSRSILIGKPLLENMNIQDVKNIIFHEIGHLANHHLLILYLFNITYGLFWTYTVFNVLPTITFIQGEGLRIALVGAVMGGLHVIVIGLVQRLLEYNADRYAASRVGSLSYSETLRSLNKLTKGGLEKVAINYPTLEQRIKNVEKVKSDE